MSDETSGRTCVWFHADNQLYHDAFSPSNAQECTLSQVLTETEYSPCFRHPESHHSCHSTRPNTSLGNGEAPSEERRRSGLLTVPVGLPLTHFSSGQAISTKTFPRLAIMKLCSSMHRTLVLYGGPIVPNGCSSRTGVGGQRFGSLLRGE